MEIISKDCVKVRYPVPNYNPINMNIRKCIKLIKKYLIIAQSIGDNENMKIINIVQPE